MNSRNDQLTRVVLPAITALTAAVFVLDLRTRLDLEVWLIYLVPLLLARSRRAAEALRQAPDDLERFALARTEELRQANGSLRTDITERKRVEEELRKGRRQLRDAHRLVNMGRWGHAR